MNRNIFLLLLLSLLLFACNNKKQMMVGTWKVVNWDYPSKDSFFTNAQRYIDTMGKGHDDATNIAIYGVANLDSLRKTLQDQYDSTKAIEENAAAKASFTFEKDGTVQLNLNGTVDTGKWLFDNDGALIIEEKGFGNPEGTSKYKVIDLTDKQLVMRFYREGDSSTVTLDHEGK